ECGAFPRVGRGDRMRGLPEAGYSLGRPQRTGAALLSDLAQPQKGLDDLDAQGQGSAGRPGQDRIQPAGLYRDRDPRRLGRQGNKLMVDRVTADNLTALGVSA